MQVLKDCDGDDACLCKNATVTAITACQQCYFTTIIQENRQMPDPRAGSTPALAGALMLCTLRDINADYTSSLCRGLSSTPHECYCPSHPGCPHTPAWLEWANRQKVEPRRDDCLRREWCDYRRWIHCNPLYYVGVWSGGVVSPASALLDTRYSSRAVGCHGGLIGFHFPFMGECHAFVASHHSCT